MRCGRPMSRPPDTRSTSRRNASVIFATAATVGLLFLYPTSLNHGRRAPGHTAPSGVVGAPRQAGTAPAPAGGTRTVTVNGNAVDTAYGPVQVQIRYRAGRILAATAIVYPQDSGRDREINSYAIPQLQQETLQAQSAQIDMVSGASYTSAGYRESLQSALDTARRQA